MKGLSLEIDGKKVEAKEGMTILEMAREAGIEIPTLCYHEKLSPYGACRLCSVEIIRGKRSRIVASCAYPVEDGLVVRTNSPQVIKIRKMLIELMLATASGAKIVEDLADQYGVEGRRFKAESTFCILCGLCVRYCTEIKKANAIGFAGRGIERRVVFIPEIASKVCAGCRGCFSVCPTGKIPRETNGVCFLDLTVEDYLSKQSK